MDLYRAVFQWQGGTIELKPKPTLTFLGATGTVTGSKYLLEANGLRILVDCGLFQGDRELRERNWRPLPFEVNKLDAVFLTHAHMDHSGYIPVLYNNGFTGPVYCTSGTIALASILLPDSGYLQEESAKYANKKGYSRHTPAEPLYTLAEAKASLGLLSEAGFNQSVHLAEGVEVTFHRAGHILGSAWIVFTINGLRITFSGDLGRPVDPVMLPPEKLQPTDYLIIESTYGNRLHDTHPPMHVLRDIVNQSVRNHGILMIPAFAVGRAQTLLHLLATLRQSGEIPEVPIFLNSPMAINATDIYCAHADEHRLSLDACRVMCETATYVNSAEESRALNRRRGPMIIISASGMASGGRILHHFKAWLGDARNTVLFAGFQAEGTLGAELLAGAKQAQIHGQSYQVKAKICAITSLSAHADSEEIRDWVSTLGTKPPKGVFITHGEPDAALALGQVLENAIGLEAEIPTYGQQIELT